MRSALQIKHQRKKCAVIWHELKISHAEKEVVEDILRQLTTKFRQDGSLTTNRGKVLDYIGMKID